MGDVSDYTAPEYAPADLQIIMSGGHNWMARMTAFLEAQERAQEAVVKAGVAGDILSAREQARLDRDAAANELAEAREFADGIVSQAEAQASEVLSKAKVEAEKMIESAKVDASVAEDRAKAANEDARSKMDEAQSAMARLAMRQAEIDAQVASINQQADDVALAKADAEAVRVRYQALADKLRAVFAEESEA